MTEADWFAKIIEEFGELQSAEKVSAEDCNRYIGRVPNGLIRFWAEHGRGNIAKTEQWICNPAIFTPLIEFVFKDDQEFNHHNMVAFAYSAFGDIDVWDRKKRYITISITWSKIIWVGSDFDPASKIFMPPKYIDTSTGLPMSEDFQLGRSLYPPPPPITSTKMTTISSPERSRSSVR